MQAINLTAIYIANLIAIVMITSMFVDGRGHLVHDSIENKCVNIMIITAVSACILDTLSFAFDGKDGIWGWLFAFGGNAMLFCLNMVIGPTWSVLVIHHVRGRIYKFERYMIFILSSIGFLLIIINCFTPIVFHVDKANVYHRDAFYLYYLSMELFFLIYGCISYYIAKSKGGILKFFPLLHFVVPIIIGLAVQTLFYGVSTIPAFVTVSICSMVNSLQRESIYRDSLTGLYNRTYLDYIKEEYTKRKGGVVTAIMIDLNNFKSINDRFGHSMGDRALIEFADILRKEIGEMGSVIRYAGDEFVILINTDSEAVICKYIDNIRKNTEQCNATSQREYQISFAIGHYSVDLKSESVEELLNKVDAKMYQNKEEFYINNPQFNRRNN